MEATGVKKHVLDETYQNKVTAVYPVIKVSATQVKQLKQKKFNALFPIKAIVRIIGVEEEEIIPGKGETFYSLEVRAIGVQDKEAEEMSPEEIADKIEQSIEEQDA